jgi:hypothetical protein
VTDGVLATRYAFAYARYQNVFCGELVSKRRGLLQNPVFLSGSHVKGEIDSRVASKLLFDTHIMFWPPGSFRRWFGRAIPHSYPDGIQSIPE